MFQKPTSAPVHVMVSMEGTLESEAFVNRLNAARGFVGLIDEIEVADVRLANNCGEGLPLPSLVLTRRSDTGTETAACGCCRSISRNASWAFLLEACVEAADRDPRPLDQLAVSGPPNALGTLTRRELDVLRLVGHGNSIAECAEALGVAPSTVGNHKYRLMRKLDVSNSLQLLRIAVRHGLADIE